MKDKLPQKATVISHETGGLSTHPGEPAQRRDTLGTEMGTGDWDGRGVTTDTPKPE